MAPPKVTTLPGRPGARPKVTTLPGRPGAKPKVKPLGKVDLPNAIDDYLGGRGSPMAGLGSAFVQAGRRHGVDPRLLVGIGVIESGAGKYTKIPHNFANWGVHSGKGYRSYEEAIDDLARGLRSGYLSKGLNTPDKIVQRYAPGSDGNDTRRWASVVSEVMQTLGGNPRSVARKPQPGKAPAAAAPRTTQGRAAVPVPAQPQMPTFSFSGGINATDLANQLLTGRDASSALEFLSKPIEITENTPPPVPVPKPTTQGTPAPAPGVVAPKTPPPSRKGVLQLPTQWKSTHPTDGLADQGFTHAEDIMGKPGTPVGAPTGGTIMRHGSAQGGESLWLQGDDGRTYWMGHIESDIPPGTKVKAGDVIARISADHAAPHVHLDYSTTYGRR